VGADPSLTPTCATPGTRSVLLVDYVRAHDTSGFHSDVAPAEATGPAAGACAHATGSVATVSLVTPDYVPQPRCLIVTHAEHLRVVNGLGGSINIRLGSWNETVAAGQTFTFPVQIGDFLAPGVHTLHFTAASSAAIWVDPVCAPAGATCSSP
jgi:hypothetical protein